MSQYNMPDEFRGGSGKFSNVPGTYHVSVTSVDTSPKGNDKILSAFEVRGTILAGTVASQKDLELKVMLWNPKISSKDNGAFAARKQARFFRAVSLVGESDAGRQDVEIDEQKAVGRQFMVSMEPGKDPKYLEVAYDRIYHVDDPEIAEIPKDVQAIGYLPVEQRLIGGEPAKSDGRVVDATRKPIDVSNI